MKQFWLWTLKQCVTQFQSLLATVQEQHCLSRDQLRDMPISILGGNSNNFCMTVDLETALCRVAVGTSACHGTIWRHALQPKRQNFRTLYWLWNLKQPSVSVQTVFCVVRGKSCPSEELNCDLLETILLPTAGNRPAVCRPDCGPWNRLFFQSQPYWHSSWRQSCPCRKTWKTPTWAPGYRPASHGLNRKDPNVKLCDETQTLPDHDHRGNTISLWE